MLFPYSPSPPKSPPPPYSHPPPALPSFSYKLVLSCAPVILHAPFQPPYSHPLLCFPFPSLLFPCFLPSYLIHLRLFAQLLLPPLFFFPPCLVPPIPNTTSMHLREYTVLVLHIRLPICLPLYHRVYGVPGFLSSRPNLVPYPPSHASECCSPPLGPSGETQTRLRGRWWEDQIRTKRQTLWYSTYIAI